MLTPYQIVTIPNDALLHQIRIRGCLIAAVSRMDRSLSAYWMMQGESELAKLEIQTIEMERKRRHLRWRKHRVFKVKSVFQLSIEYHDRMIRNADFGVIMLDNPNYRSIAEEVVAHSSIASR